jgi:hypothetical protein
MTALRSLPLGSMLIGQQEDPDPRLPPATARHMFMGLFLRQGAPYPVSSRILRSV